MPYHIFCPTRDNYIKRTHNTGSLDYVKFSYIIQESQIGRVVGTVTPLHPPFKKPWFRLSLIYNPHLHPQSASALFVYVVWQADMSPCRPIFQRIVIVICSRHTSPCEMATTWHLGVPASQPWPTTVGTRLPVTWPHTARKDRVTWLVDHTYVSEESWLSLASLYDWRPPCHIPLNEQ